HPVLGTAFVLGGPLQRVTIRLETGVGVVPVELERQGPQIVFGRMEQPIPTWEPYGLVEELLASLGVAEAASPLEAYTNGPTYVYVELAGAEVLAGLNPDMRALAALETAVACYAGAEKRWKARLFAPADGIDEDPA